MIQGRDYSDVGVGAMVSALSGNVRGVETVSRG
jgi:hypothetical protein